MNGDRTGKDGIDSAEAFLNEQLGKNHATDHIGQEIEDIENKITITMNGLISAAHREGVGGTNQYLTHLAKHGWKSDPDTFPENKRAMFLRVERRPRLLQDAPNSKCPAP